jgi:uncharacterized protein YjbJ (UPF0337 family)
MDKDRVAGAGKQAKGAAKEAAGRATDDAKAVAEGRGERTGRRLQNMIGCVEDTVRNALGGKGRNR